jgi:hypothetical protein
MKEAVNEVLKNVDSKQLEQVLIIIINRNPENIK